MKILKVPSSRLAIALFSLTFTSFPFLSVAADSHSKLSLNSPQSSVKFTIDSPMVITSGKLTSYTGHMMVTPGTSIPQTIDFSVNIQGVSLDHPEPQAQLLLMSILSTVPWNTLHFTSSDIRSTSGGKYLASGFAETRNKRVAVQLPLAVDKGKNGGLLLHGRVDRKQFHDRGSAEDQNNPFLQGLKAQVDFVLSFLPSSSKQIS